VEPRPLRLLAARVLLAAGLGVGLAASAGVVLAAGVGVGLPAGAGVTRANPRASGGLGVIVEPAAGPSPIYHLLDGARRSIDLTMYELRDTTAESDLARAAARGVDVRVLLDQHLERRRNTPAYDYLARRGVHVEWGPRTTTVHQKSITVDGTTAVVMTLNLVSEDYPDTRDFAVVDTRTADVAAMEETFDAEYDHRSLHPPRGSDLIWSPTSAQAGILAVINGAQRTLRVETEEMTDPAVVGALAQAARRRVDVQVVMTVDPADEHDLAELARNGVHVHLFPERDGVLYIHAKAIVADAGSRDAEVFVGSQNLSIASLEHDDELGIVTTDPAVVAIVGRTISTDAASAQAEQ
jgi:cardiolipin synthase A/B